MPPAFVLSQDQTLKFVSQYYGTKAKPQPTAISNFGSRYLHLSNVMDTKDMYDIGLINRYPEPEDPQTGRRRPHVPSSKTNNVKEPTDKLKRTTIRSRSLHLGRLASVYVGDRAFLPFEAAFPSGEAAYMEAIRVGQTVFDGIRHKVINPMILND